MSLARSDGQGARISLVLAVVFPAMIGAALALAYVAYQDTEGVSSVIEASFRRTFQKSAEAHAAEEVQAVEKEMNAAVHATLARVAQALEDPAQVRAACNVLREPAIEAIVVFDAVDRGPRCGVRAVTEWRPYLPLFKKVPDGKFNYDHRMTGDVSRLTALAAQTSSDGRRHWVAFKLNLRHVQKLFEPALQKLGKGYRVAVVNETGDVLGDLVSGGSGPRAQERFVYEGPLGQALYGWTVRMGPQAVELQELEARMKRQRAVRPLLVLLATATMVLGLGIVFRAVIAERRASRLKSDFIANVSHELKTPLSLIRMFGEMVATGRHKGEAAAREYGSIITRESERLSHLIDNVLDFARLERGKASYDFAEGDVGLVLERAIDVCRYRLEKERMRISTQVDPDLPLVRMDEDAITLVVLNLLDNAIKYASEGGEVAVSLSRSPGGVVLAVRDFGPGIDLAEQGRIFERFYRAERERGRNVRGSGIGLALVKHIAEAHGGRVTVESPVLPAVVGAPSGSTFRVFLPAPIQEGSESAARHELARSYSSMKS